MRKHSKKSKKNNKYLTKKSVHCVSKIHFCFVDIGLRIEMYISIEWQHTIVDRLIFISLLGNFRFKIHNVWLQCFQWLLVSTRMKLNIRK